MLNAFVSYKLQHWYTFVIGLAITVSNRWNTSLINRKPKSTGSNTWNDTTKNRTKTTGMSDKNSFTMISRCRCGQCELNIHYNTMLIDTDTDTDNDNNDSKASSAVNDILDTKKQNHILKPDTTQTFDCYCHYCRTYHGGAFTSYLMVCNNQIHITKQTTMKYYIDTCNEIGTNITRIFCSQCYCKLATTTTDNDITQQKWYINMGCIADETIRADYSIYWRTHRIRKQQENEGSVLWYPAIPKYKKKNYNKQNQHTSSLSSTKDTILTGGCSCKNVQYKILPYIDIPNELPHCYCHLCRQMSGTAFVSWLYVTTKNLIWTINTNNTLKLIRTTDFGQRHVCTNCGVVLTIVYDKEKNKYIWPTAASIYNLPNIDLFLESVSHIYCHNNSIWYQLPNDGLPRYYDE